MNELIQQPAIDFNPPRQAEPEPPPTPDNPPWGGWAALGVWFVSVLLIVFTPMIFLAPYIVSQGMTFGDQGVVQEFIRTDQTAIILQLAPMILAHAVTFLIAWFVVTKFNTYSFRQTLGWKMGWFKIWHAVLLFFLYYLIAIGLQFALGKVENEFDALIKSSRYAVYLIAFYATFTAPLVEEVIYRGLLYSAFQRRFGMVLSVIFVTLLFTAVHVPQYSLGKNPDFATIITLLLLSLTLTGLRASTGNLMPSIVLHTVFNGIQSAVLLAEPYIRLLEPVAAPPVSLFVP